MRQRGAAELCCYECGHKWTKTGVMEWKSAGGVYDGHEDLFSADGTPECPRCEAVQWGWTRFHAARQHEGGGCGVNECMCTSCESVRKMESAAESVQVLREQNARLVEENVNLRRDNRRLTDLLYHAEGGKD